MNLMLKILLFTLVLVSELAHSSEK